MTLPAEAGGRLRALLVAFYFPPTAGGGIERTLRFAAGLPEHGVDVEVLAPTDARWLADDPSSLARLPAGLRVHRCRYRGPGNRVLPRERLAAATGTRERLAVRARLLPRRLLLPDVDAPWLVDVVPAACRLLASGRFDALVTTSPPHSVTLAGAAITVRSGVPWVADWRDPWLRHPDLALERAAVRAKLAVTAPLARLAARRIAAATCVNEAIAAEVRALAPAVPATVIRNGVDLDELERLERSPDPARLTLCFAGYFFGDRSPRALLAGLARVVAARPGLRSLLRVRFIGGFRAEDRALVAALGIDDLVSIEGSRPRAEALQALRDADVDVLFMQDGDGRGASFVPQKTWEYLALRRPVLALVPPTGAAAAELRVVGAEIVAPEDVGAAAAALERLIRRFERGQLVDRSLDDALRERVSATAGVAAMAGVIRRAVEQVAAT